MCDMEIRICKKLSGYLKACIQMCDPIPYTDLDRVICPYSLYLLLIIPSKNNKHSPFTIYISL